MAMILARARHCLERMRSIGQVGMLSCFGYRGSRDVHLSAGVRVTDDQSVVSAVVIQLGQGLGPNGSYASRTLRRTRSPHRLDDTLVKDGT
jgi:hypothetical protein